MRSAPATHRVRSHGALRDGMAAHAKGIFAGSERAWDPTRPAPGLDDLGRGFLDSYALALHVLWAYQHAWADEGFLATARLARSGAALMELIGYQPRPALSATGLQHFRIKDRVSTTIPPGFKVIAPAGPAGPAATYETLGALHASFALNEMRPFLPPSGRESSTTGAISDLLAAIGQEVDVPTPTDLFGSSSVADQIGARLDGAGMKGARVAARARAKALQLASVLRDLKDSNQDALCGDGFDKLCDELCKQCEEVAQQKDLTFRRSEAAEMVIAQLARLARQLPEALASLEAALARCPGETDEQWSKRLDALALFLGALTGSLLQQARDDLLRLKGPRALAELTALDGSAPPGSRGIAGPGTDSLYILPLMLDPEAGPQTHAGLIRPGDWMILAEETLDPSLDGAPIVRRRGREALKVLRVQEEVPPGRKEPMTRIVFAPSLSGRYDLAGGVLVGNVVPISHGSTVVETVTGRDLQPLRLAEGPLTRVRSNTAPGGIEAPVKVKVAGLDWAPVPDLLDPAPAARIFSVEPAGDPGVASVRTGNGVTGLAVPPEAPVEVSYRVGAGPEGNRMAGGIIELGGDDPALVATVNLLPVTGGTQGETAESARRHGAAGIHAMDRAVSVNDIASLALTFGGIRRAAVFRDTVRRKRNLTVVVSGEGARALSPDEHRDLRAFLLSRVPPGTQITTFDRTVVPVRTLIRVRIVKGSDPLAVIREVRWRLGVDPAATQGLLHAEVAELGQDVNASDLYGALGEIPGLASCLVERLHRAGAPELRQEGIQVGPTEIALWDPADDMACQVVWEEAVDL